MDKKYMLFDLDGTLTDPQEGITNSVAYALEQYGIHMEDRSSLNKFIGPPLKDSFMEYYGFTEDRAEEAVWKYREYFNEDGIFENKVYPGIPQMLQHLKDQGKILIVATSKPTVYAKRILERFELSQYFADVQGSEMDGRRTKKEEVISYALEQNQITDNAQAVMIGDREHDIIGAKKCGLDSIGVLFGYGSREEMEGCGAGQIVDTVQMLEDLLSR
ncbi:HAD family hydrolase [uncultured Robinsoniella sp.]|uniref:HAD family hydrolase n=1 Tax=uncultured Robinsoniella sp. TaxID=904190 RepID=UPI00374F960E